jgi:hypothetical protein
MDIAGSEKAPNEAPVAVQIIRVAFVATMIVVAVWIAANFALDSLVAPFITK